MPTPTQTNIYFLSEFRRQNTLQMINWWITRTIERLLNAPSGTLNVLYLNLNSFTKSWHFSLILISILNENKYCYYSIWPITMLCREMCLDDNDIICQKYLLTVIPVHMANMYNNETVVKSLECFSKHIFSFLFCVSGSSWCVSVLLNAFSRPHSRLFRSCHVSDTLKMSGILCWVSPDGLPCWCIHNAVVASLWVKAFFSGSEVRVQTSLWYQKLETQIALQVGHATMLLPGHLDFYWWPVFATLKWLHPAS